MAVMSMARIPGAGPIGRLLPAHRAEEEARIRQAAWVARCVGRGEAAPLHPADVSALAGTLSVREFRPGGVAFKAGDAPAGGLTAPAPPVALSRGSRPRPAPVPALPPP